MSDILKKYSIVIAADTKELMQELNKVQDTLTKKLGDKDITAGVRSSLDKLRQEVQTMQSELRVATRDINQSISSIGAQGLEQEFTKMQQVISEDIANMQQSVSGLQTSLDNLNKTGGLSQLGNSIDSTLSKINSSMEGIITKFDEFQAVYKNGGQIKLPEINTKSVDKATDQIKKASKTTRDALNEMLNAYQPDMLSKWSTGVDKSELADAQRLLDTMRNMLDLMTSMDEESKNRVFLDANIFDINEKTLSSNIKILNESINDTINQAKNELKRASADMYLRWKTELDPESTVEKMVEKIETYQEGVESKLKPIKIQTEVDTKSLSTSIKNAISEQNDLLKNPDGLKIKVGVDVNKIDTSKIKDISQDVSDNINANTNVIANQPETSINVNSEGLAQESTLSEIRDTLAGWSTRGIPGTQTKEQIHEENKVKAELNNTKAFLKSGKLYGVSSEQESLHSRKQQLKEQFAYDYAQNLVLKQASKMGSKMFKNPKLLEDTDLYKQTVQVNGVDYAKWDSQKRTAEEFRAFLKGILAKDASLLTSQNFGYQNISKYNSLKDSLINRKDEILNSITREQGKNNVNQDVINKLETELAEIDKTLSEEFDKLFKNYFANLRKESEKVIKKDIENLQNNKVSVEQKAVKDKYGNIKYKATGKIDSPNSKNAYDDTYKQVRDVKSRILNGYRDDAGVYHDGLDVEHSALQSLKEKRKIMQEIAMLDIKSKTATLSDDEQRTLETRKEELRVLTQECEDQALFNQLIARENELLQKTQNNGKLESSEFTEYQSILEKKQTMWHDASDDMVQYSHDNLETLNKAIDEQQTKVSQLYKKFYSETGKIFNNAREYTKDGGRQKDISQAGIVIGNNSNDKQFLNITNDKGYKAALKEYEIQQKELLFLKQSISYSQDGKSDTSALTKSEQERYWALEKSTYQLRHQIELYAELNNKSKDDINNIEVKGSAIDKVVSSLKNGNNVNKTESDILNQMPVGELQQFISKLDSALTTASDTVADNSNKKLTNVLDERINYFNQHIKDLETKIQQIQEKNPNADIQYEQNKLNQMRQDKASLENIKERHNEQKDALATIQKEHQLDDETINKLKEILDLTLQIDEARNKANALANKADTLITGKRDLAKYNQLQSELDNDTEYQNLYKHINSSIVTSNQYADKISKSKSRLKNAKTDDARKQIQNEIKQITEYYNAEIKRQQDLQSAMIPIQERRIEIEGQISDIVKKYATKSRVSAGKKDAIAWNEANQLVNDLTLQRESLRNSLPAMMQENASQPNLTRFNNAFTRQSLDSIFNKQLLLSMQTNLEQSMSQLDKTSDEYKLKEIDLNKIKEQISKMDEWIDKNVEEYILSRLSTYNADKTLQNIIQSQSTKASDKALGEGVRQRAQEVLDNKLQAIENTNRQKEEQKAIKEAEAKKNARSKTTKTKEVNQKYNSRISELESSIAEGQPAIEEATLNLKKAKETQDKVNSSLNKYEEFNQYQTKINGSIFAQSMFDDQISQTQANISSNQAKFTEMNKQKNSDKHRKLYKETATSIDSLNNELNTYIESKKIEIANIQNQIKDYENTRKNAKSQQAKDLLTTQIAGLNEEINRINNDIGQKQKDIRVKIATISNDNNIRSLSPVFVDEFNRTQSDLETNQKLLAELEVKKAEKLEFENKAIAELINERAKSRTKYSHMYKDSNPEEVLNNINTMYQSGNFNAKSYMDEVLHYMSLGGDYANLPSDTYNIFKSYIDAVKSQSQQVVAQAQATYDSAQSSISGFRDELSNLNKSKEAEMKAIDLYEIEKTYVQSLEEQFKIANTSKSQRKNQGITSDLFSYYSGNSITKGMSDAQKQTSFAVDYFLDAITKNLTNAPKLQESLSSKQKLYNDYIATDEYASRKKELDNANKLLDELVFKRDKLKNTNTKTYQELSQKIDEQQNVVDKLSSSKEIKQEELLLKELDRVNQEFLVQEQHLTILKKLLSEYKTEAKDLGLKISTDTGRAYLDDSKATTQLGKDYYTGTDKTALEQERLRQEELAKSVELEKQITDARLKSVQVEYTENAIIKSNSKENKYTTNMTAEELELRNKLITAQTQLYKMKNKNSQATEKEKADQQVIVDELKKQVEASERLDLVKSKGRYYANLKSQYLPSDLQKSSVNNTVTNADYSSTAIATEGTLSQIRDILVDKLGNTNYKNANTSNNTNTNSKDKGVFNQKGYLETAKSMSNITIKKNKDGEERVIKSDRQKVYAEMEKRGIPKYLSEETKQINNNTKATNENTNAKNKNTSAKKTNTQASKDNNQSQDSKTNQSNQKSNKNFKDDLYRKIGTDKGWMTKDGKRVKKEFRDQVYLEMEKVEPGSTGKTVEQLEEIRQKVQGVTAAKKEDIDITKEETKIVIENIEKISQQIDTLQNRLHELESDSSKSKEAKDISNDLNKLNQTKTQLQDVLKNNNMSSTSDIKKDSQAVDENTNKTKENKKVKSQDTSVATKKETLETNNNTKATENNTRAKQQQIKYTQEELALAKELGLRITENGTNVHKNDRAQLNEAIIKSQTTSNNVAQNLFNTLTGDDRIKKFNELAKLLGYTPTRDDLLLNSQAMNNLRNNPQDGWIMASSEAEKLAFEQSKITEQQLLEQLKNIGDAAIKGYTQNITGDSKHWTHFQLGKGTNPGYDINGAIYKVYGSFDKITDLNQHVIQEIMGLLQKVGFNGQLKTDKHTDTIAKSDQLVIHGATREDQIKAYQVLNYYSEMCKSLSFIGTGFDYKNPEGKVQSFSSLLENASGEKGFNLFNNLIKTLEADFFANFSKYNNIDYLSKAGITQSTLSDASNVENVENIKQKEYSETSIALAKLINEYYELSKVIGTVNATPAIENRFSQLDTFFDKKLGFSPSFNEDGSLTLVNSQGDELTKTYAEGILKNTASVKNAAIDMAEITPQTVAEYLQISSPSKVMKELGFWTVEGFNEGILENSNSIKSTIREALASGKITPEEVQSLIGWDGIDGELKFDKRKRPWKIFSRTVNAQDFMSEVVPDVTTSAVKEELISLKQARALVKEAGFKGIKDSQLTEGAKKVGNQWKIAKQNVEEFIAAQKEAMLNTSPDNKDIEKLYNQYKKELIKQNTAQRNIDNGNDVNVNYNKRENAIKAIEQIEKQIVEIRAQGVDLSKYDAEISEIKRQNELNLLTTKLSGYKQELIALQNVENQNQQFQVQVKNLSDMINEYEYLTQKEILSADEGQRAVDLKKNISALISELNTLKNSNVEITTFDSLSDSGQIINMLHNMSGIQKESVQILDSGKRIVGTIKEGNGASRTLEYTWNDILGKFVQSTSVMSTQLSLWDRLKIQVAKSANYFKSYFSGYMVAQRIISSVRTGITYIKDLDSALTEMKKVSDESTDSLKAFQKQSFDIAHSIGTTAVEIQKSAADFMRLGYSLKESTQLAQDANVYANVGDMDIETATEHMISSIKAWESEFSSSTEASMALIDKYNEIGNNYAITSADIGSAMERSAAALKVAGNSLDESIGLITAGNLIQQDADTTANALKVMSLRIRGSKADLEDMGEEVDDLASSTSKLRDEIKALTGVDIMQDDNTYKSTAKIIQEIGAQWDKLSDISKATTLEKLAGKTRASTVAGLLENYEVIAEVAEDAANAQGSALRENAEYMDSIEGRTAQLQSQIQEFWYTLISSDTIKSLVSSLTTILDLLTKLIDKAHLLPTILTGVAGVLGVKGSGLTNPKLTSPLLQGCIIMLYNYSSDTFCGEK